MKSLCFGVEVSVNMFGGIISLEVFVCDASVIFGFVLLLSKTCKILDITKLFLAQEKAVNHRIMVLGMIGSMMQMLAVLLCLTSLHLCLFTAWYSGFRVFFTRLENVHLQDIKFLRNATHLLMLFNGDPHALKMHARVPPVLLDVPHEKTT